MKQILFNKKYPNGRLIDVAEPNTPVAPNPIREFFEGLSSADTNSIAKIRALARAFLEGEEI
ncbi:MAG: hypothetical protein IKL62_01970 [Clostridia bacterium]|nr:hypothetical protein [Oscillospiraceae bacterium]MBR6693698.1 hypothetical protein [Clostridia bacterium]